MIYRILRAIVKPIFCLLYRVKIDGAENGKIDGRTMVIANYKSNCDPILMHLLFKPKIRLMAKKELFKNRFFGAVLRAFGAFPVSRGESDAAAVSNAMKMVADGELVGIFPEGTRIKGTLRQIPARRSHDGYEIQGGDNPCVYRQKAQAVSEDACYNRHSDRFFGESG